MVECQFPSGGCLYDDEAHACPLCHEHGADDIAKHYAERSTITPKTISDFTKVCEQTGILGTEAPKTD